VVSRRFHIPFRLRGRAPSLQPGQDREIVSIGTSHRDLKGIEESLKPGDMLPLQREPDNAHDELAIKILDERGHHLGYVPRAKNEALARLMDAGKLLFGRIENKAWQGAWLMVDIRVFMRDF
jgi:hypothetical protein